MAQTRRFPLLDDVEWLRRRYEREGASALEIAEEIGCTNGVVSIALRGHGIKTRTPQEQMRLRGTGKKSGFAELNDSGWLQRHYIEKALSQAQIAALIGCVPPLVHRALRRHGIEARKPGGVLGRQSAKRIAELHDREWLQREYREKRRTAQELAEELSCSAWSVLTRASDAGVKRRRKQDGIEPIGFVPELWKRKEGYILARMPEHPFADIRGYVAAHRLVAERELGRILGAKEVVHHVNQKRNDNRPENLMVFENNRTHMAFHTNPPAWVPRCSCCGKPNPEILTGRPVGVPMMWGAQA